MIRKLIFHKNHFLEFYHNRELKVQEKIEYIFYIIRNSEIIPSKFFKLLQGTDGLYEVRIQFGRSIYRIFCFFDEAGSVIVLNGIQKKSQKVPKKDIMKAEKLRQEYYYEKDNPHER